jgi:transcriptional regulator with XRE-family HTH domain
MTPFGAKLRELRAERGVTLKAMAEAIGVSAAYLSALEHGRRGTPTWYLIQRIITFFNVIWDEAEELERLAQDSDPRVVVDTAGLSERATELANRLARHIGTLTEPDIEALLGQLNRTLRDRQRR